MTSESIGLITEALENTIEWERNVRRTRVKVASHWGHALVKG
jgi:hypothetical protein